MEPCSRARRGAFGGLVAALALAAGCGGPAPPSRTNVAPRRPPDAPLPTEANRNAPPPAPAAGSEAATGGVPRMVLWCSQPTGPACVAAQQELGLPPSPTPAVPAALLAGARDLDDDCTDPELAPLMQRVTAAVGSSSGGWVDQEGQILGAEMIPDLYSGSGCTNAATPGDPPLKIHLVPLDGEPHFLVRVWEVGEE